MENSQETKQTLLKKEIVVPVLVTSSIGILGFLFGRKIGRAQGASAMAQQVLNKDPELWMNVYKALNNK